MPPKNFNTDYLSNLLGMNGPIIKIKKLMLERSYNDKWHHQDQLSSDSQCMVSMFYDKAIRYYFISKMAEIHFSKITPLMFSQ